MPDAVNNTPLDPLHAAYREALYSTLDDSEFINLVCNTGLVLPEHKLPNTYHLPCVWLGGQLSRSVLPANRAREQAVNLGWRPVRYLAVIPNPSSRDLADKVALHPQSDIGELVREELKRAGIPLTQCVATHVCRFDLPRSVNKYGQRHKNSCLAYLQADIENCKPDVIIAFGADSLKALFGKHAKLDTFHGDVLTYTTHDGSEIPVVPTYNPLAFLGGHAEIEVFRSDLRKAHELGEGVYSTRRVNTTYRVCRTADEVEELCNLIRAVKPPWIAFDTEFGNSCARDEHTETISIQLSWGAGTGAFIQLTEQVEVCKPPPEIEEYVPPTPVPWDEYAALNYKDPTAWFAKHPGAEAKLHAKWVEQEAKRQERAHRRYLAEYASREKQILWREGFEYHYAYNGKFYRAGQPLHDPESWHRIWYSVQQLLLDKQWRICAHHLRTDCYQFERNGYSITERIEDGLDTMLIHHLLYGDENQGLDLLARKYTPHYGAFWSELESYLDRTGKRKWHLQYGYRNIPFDILIPYALCDADVTWQCCEKLLLELNEHPRLKKLYFTHVAPTTWHIYQMEREGILIDEEQRTAMREAYTPVYEALLQRVRDEICWPGFNPASDAQMKTLLFYGATYKDPKPPPEFDPPVRLLGLQPLFNTDKYPVDWATIVEKGEEEYNTPAVSAQALDLLFQRNKGLHILKTLKHLSVIGKFLTSYLAPQLVNAYGVPEDGKGFHNNIWADGRVRTNISQLTETGRYSSFKANLQTKPKKQEAAAFEALVDFYFGCSVEEYKKRCDPKYEGEDRIEVKDQINVPKFASCFIAPPGYCLVEADFATAEVFIWAYASGDEALIRLVNNGRDSHSENTLKSFQLPELSRLQPAIDALEAGDRKPYDALCEEVKSKYNALRIAAKAVLFGIMYGRGAAALAREINKVVADPVSIEDTQRVIDGIAAAYPVAWKWLVDNSEFAVENEYVENPFGRRRYFSGARQLSDWDKAAVKREAKNSPIQGAVADLLAKAGYTLHRMLRKLKAIGKPIDMKILLPIHDAFLFQIKYEDLPRAIPLIETCMSTKNNLPDTEYHLGVDIEVFAKRWSDKGVNPHKEGQLEAFMQKYAQAA